MDEIGKPHTDLGFALAREKDAWELAKNLLGALETLTLEALMANTKGRPVDQEKIDQAHEMIKTTRGEV